MTFDRGQGGNLAIKEADDFVTRMTSVRDGKVPLAEAINQYDKGTLERGQEVVISTAQSAAFHDYANIKESPVFKMGIKPSSS